MPYISIEGCNGAQVVATLESKATLNIQVTASQSVSFEYPKDPGTFDPNDENVLWIRGKAEEVLPNLVQQL